MEIPFEDGDYLSKILGNIQTYIFFGTWFQALKLEFGNRKFMLQSFTKYLKPTLVFMRNCGLREKFNFCFSRDFC